MDEEGPGRDAQYGQLRTIYGDLLRLSATLNRADWSTQPELHVAAAHVDIAASHLYLACEAMLQRPIRDLDRADPRT